MPRLSKLYHLKDSNFTNLTLVELCAKYNVSERTIRNECRRRGIKYRKTTKVKPVTLGELRTLETMTLEEAAESLNLTLMQFRNRLSRSSIKMLYLTEEERNFIIRRRELAED
jgi:hypothetical protein